MLAALPHFSMVSASNKKRKRRWEIRQNYGLMNPNLMMKMKMNVLPEEMRANKILMTLTMVKIPSKISILA